MDLTTHIMEVRCPKCGDLHDRVTNAGPFEAALGIENTTPPVEGDWNVCFNCGAVLRFTSDFKLGTIPRADRHNVPERVKKLAETVLKRGRLRAGNQ